VEEDADEEEYEEGEEEEGEEEEEEEDGTALPVKLGGERLAGAVCGRCEHSGPCDRVDR